MGVQKNTHQCYFQYPAISRRYRDDLTVTVVFFGKDPAGENDNGTLEINWNATAGGPDASKPKL